MRGDEECPCRIDAERVNRVPVRSGRGFEGTRGSGGSAMSQLIALAFASRASEPTSPLLTPTTSRFRRSSAVAGATSDQAGYSLSKDATRAMAADDGFRRRS